MMQFLMADVSSFLAVRLLPRVFFRLAFSFLRISFNLLSCFASRLSLLDFSTLCSLLTSNPNARLFGQELSLAFFKDDCS